MCSGKTLTSAERGQIDILKQEGYSNREIVRRIARSAKVINNYLHDKENYGRNRRGGVKYATTDRLRRNILRTASNRPRSARQIAAEVGASCSIRTVQRIIESCPHIKRMKMKRKPALKASHREARLAFAQQHMGWTSQWQHVVFTDEKKFNLDGPDGFSYYFHDVRKDELILSRRHSTLGSVMVWGAISYNGAIDLTILQGRQNAETYRELLNTVKGKISETIESQEWILQQDNASIHRAQSVQNWFQEENIRVLPWPALSTDLNLIENVWGWMARRVFANGMQFERTADLIDAIKSVWNEIPLDYLRKLYHSMPRRIFEVIKNRGGHTKY